MNGSTARALRRQAVKSNHRYADRPRLAVRSTGLSRRTYRGLKREHTRLRSGR